MATVVSPARPADRPTLPALRTTVPAASARVVAACVIGAGIALSGFPPLNDLPGRLHVAALPGFALATPAVLLALLGVWMSRGRSAARPVPRVAEAVIGLLLLGGCLSLTATHHGDASTAALILGIVVPTCIFVAVRRGSLPVTVLAGAFLAVLTVVLVWADLVYLRDNGLPTPSKLFYAKFVNQAYGFHYYTLGNPDHTATFLLLPLTLCLVWLGADDLSRRARRSLIAATVVLLLTLLLLYARLPIAVAFVMVLIAVARSRLAPRVRLAILGTALLAAAFLAISSPAGYLTHIFSTGGTSSGGVRINSISAGFRTFGHEPLTGVGLGQYGVAPGVPAHSSVVQAGAEMGLVGMLGLALMTVALPIAAVARLRHGTRASLAEGALAGAAVYVIVAAFSAGADDGLFVGLVSIYGMTLALFAGIALAPNVAAPTISVGESFRRTRRAAGARMRARVLSWRARSGPAWLAYGLAWTPIAVLITAPRLPHVAALGSTRRQELSAVILARSHGFGPLVEMLGPHNFYPAGLTDDQGSYLVTPWLSTLLHTSSVNTVIRDFFLFGLCTIVAAYPIAIRRLADSRLAALASPLLALAFFSFMIDDGFYWVPAATLAICLPWLLIFVRERAPPTAPLMLIAIVAGVTQLFRAQMGLGLLVAAVAVAVLASATRLRRAVVIGLMVLAYIAFSTGVLDLALEARTARMGGYPVNTHGYAGVTRWSDGSGHPLWHTLYIGLGVVHNRYGISYSDNVARRYVAHIDPTAAFVSARYESIVRKRVLHLAASDPAFVFRAEKRKLGETLADGLRRFWPLLVMIPLALLVGAGRGRRRRYAAVFVPVALIAALPPLVAVPILDYEMPWLGLLATIGILCSGWILARAAASGAVVQDLLRQHPLADPLLVILARWRVRLSAALTRSRQIALRPVTFVAAVVAHALASSGQAAWSLIRPFGPILTDWSIQQRLFMALRSRRLYVALAVVLVGFLARGYLEHWQANIVAASSPLNRAALPFNASLPAPLVDWRLASLPSGWRADTTTRATAGNRLRVLTTSGNNAYQLESAVVSLPPGRYVAAVRGEIRSGGLQLGVLDVHANKWIQIANYANKLPPGPATMTTYFDVTSPRPVQVILSNYSPVGHSSTWLLNEAFISSRTGRSPGVALPFNTPLPASVNNWQLAKQPKGWIFDTTTHATAGGAIALITTPHNNAYQLQSPVVSLPPGRYVAAVRGEIRSGGLQLGVLDVHANRWVQAANYESKVPSQPATMIEYFDIISALPVQVVLSNYAPFGGSSNWLVNQVLIAPRDGASTPSAASSASPAASASATTPAANAPAPRSSAVNR